MNATSHRQLKILVIDDDPEFLEMAAELLRIGGYQLLSALSGEEGVRRGARSRSVPISSFSTTTCRCRTASLCSID